MLPLCKTFNFYRHQFQHEHKIPVKRIFEAAAKKYLLHDIAGLHAAKNTMKGQKKLPLKPLRERQELLEWL